MHKDIFEAIRKIGIYQRQWIQVDEPRFARGVSAFICFHLRLIFNPPQRTQRTQSEALTLWYEKTTTWRNGTRMTRIRRIFTDTKSVRIRVIRAIRVLSQLLSSAVKFSLCPLCSLWFFKHEDNKIFRFMEA